MNEYWHVYMISSARRQTGKWVDHVQTHIVYDVAAKKQAQEDFISEIESLLEFPLSEDQNKKALRLSRFFVQYQGHNNYWLVLLVKEESGLSKSMRR